MRFYIGLAAIIGIFAALVAAAPSFGFAWPWSYRQHQQLQTTASSEQQETCMTKKEAHIAADIFRRLIQEYTHELALEALTEDFVDYASSVNIIINKGASHPKDMNAPTFASRAAFIDGQGKQPQIPFETIKVFPGCRHVSMRWKSDRSANGHASEVDKIPVHGNVIVEVEPSEPGNTFNWRVSHIWSEFNSAAWLVNLGVFKPGGMAPEAQDIKHMLEFDEFEDGDEVPYIEREDI
ncbi:hypothetical protein AC578_6538 [Pseudocercospora eumusae]|uniref:NTF2-like domain-containing protein n=1 Tax=Pseudocercospora eumusae TaxID=321146 RepID=A0A139HI05_9PEZI|nr:hypothetical protein AC578_6538 [Pseudocercospora eumusae]